MFVNKKNKGDLVRTYSSDNLNERVNSYREKNELKSRTVEFPVKMITSLKLEEVARRTEIKKLTQLTPRSLALSVYKIYLDLGSETLEILKGEGLGPDHFLLDIGPRFQTACYLSAYLKSGRYHAVAETSNENNSLEICDTYVELATGENKLIDCVEMTIKDFCKSDLLEHTKFNFILVQRNLACFEDKDLDSFFYKVVYLLRPAGKIMANYVENFPDKPGGFPMIVFKRVLARLSGLGLSVRTSCYKSPMNLRMLCITLKTE